MLKRILFFISILYIWIAFVILNWKVTYSYSTAFLYFEALFCNTLYIGIDILQILWLWTMAGRGRMKLCILQVLCMYFSVTVIFIFRSWSKTQKVAFYIYISWNISYSSYFKRNVEGQICCCSIWTSVLIKLFVFCRAPSPPIYACFLFLQIIASFVIGVNCMFCNSKNHKQEEQSVLFYCVTYINDCILIHCWLANKKNWLEWNFMNWKPTVKTK